MQGGFALRVQDGFPARLNSSNKAPKRLSTVMPWSHAGLNGWWRRRLLLHCGRSGRCSGLCSRPSMIFSSKPHHEPFRLAVDQGITASSQAIFSVLLIRSGLRIIRRGWLSALLHYRNRLSAASHPVSLQITHIAAASHRW